MFIKRIVDPVTGATGDVVTFTAEEESALEEAKDIVAARYRELGLDQDQWSEQQLGYMLWGILRFEGIEKMLEWARTAKISQGKQILPRGYA